MTNGKLIAIEGMDGSGKSTAINYANEYLKSRGLKSEDYRQPDGVYREMIMKTFGHPRLAYDRAVLAMLSRRRFIHESLLLAKDLKDVVLTDRFNFSTYCIHGIYEDQLGLINALGDYDRYKFFDHVPDATIYLSCPAEVCWVRKHNSTTNEYEKTATQSSFTDLHRVFESQAQLNEGARGVRNGFGHIYIIDSNRDVRDVYLDLTHVIDAVLAKN